MRKNYGQMYMPINILMPALSPTMTSGNLVKWLVKEGDPIKAGMVMAEIETDKAIMEFEAVDEGVLGKILVSEGTSDVPINQPIAVLLEKGETVADIAASPVAAPQPEPAAVVQIQSPIVAQPQPVQPPPQEEVFSGPVAQKTVREALREAMAEEMRRDAAVFIMGEEVGQYQGAYKVTQGLLDEFGPKRVVDTPISEQGFAGLGVGAAFGGLKPVVEFMTINFAMQAIDQIVNSAAKTLYMSGGQMGCPIVFRGPNGAAARVAAQHSQDYAAWYAHIPGLKVIAPYTAADAKGLLKAAIRDPNPVVFLESERLYGASFDVPTDADYIIPIGRAKVMRAGTQVTIVSYSHALTFCLEAVEQLEKEGISCELIDLRTIRPLDIDTIVASVQKTGRLVSVDQTWPMCGVGSEIAAQVQEKAFDYLDAPIQRITQKDVPMPYAANLEHMALPSAAEVAEAVRAVCYR